MQDGQGKGLIAYSTYNVYRGSTVTNWGHTGLHNSGLVFSHSLYPGSNLCVIRAEATVWCMYADPTLLSASRVNCYGERTMGLFWPLQYLWWEKNGAVLAATLSMVREEWGCPGRYIIYGERRMGLSWPLHYLWWENNGAVLAVIWGKCVSNMVIHLAGG
jgi:hypothetical protein